MRAAAPAGARRPAARDVPHVTRGPPCRAVRAASRATLVPGERRQLCWSARVEQVEQLLLRVARLNHRLVVAGGATARRGGSRRSKTGKLASTVAPSVVAVISSWWRPRPAQAKSMPTSPPVSASTSSSLTEPSGRDVGRALVNDCRCGRAAGTPVHAGQQRGRAGLEEALLQRDHQPRVVARRTRPTRSGGSGRRRRAGSRAAVRTKAASRRRHVGEDEPGALDDADVLERELDQLEGVWRGRAGAARARGRRRPAGHPRRAGRPLRRRVGEQPATVARAPAAGARAWRCRPARRDVHLEHQRGGCPVRARRRRRRAARAATSAASGGNGAARAGARRGSSQPGEPRQRSRWCSTAWR